MYKISLSRLGLTLYQPLLTIIQISFKKYNDKWSNWFETAKELVLVLPYL